MPMPRPTHSARASSWACRSEAVAGGAAHPEQMLHASCVTLNGRAALIRGASGQGKSGLALQLIALGATLVTDDRARVWRENGHLMVDAPDPIRGRIEARGLGILHLPSFGPAQITCIVDLDRATSERLPIRDHATVMDLSLPVFAKSPHPHFPAALLLYLQYGALY